jgi:hypothetical protein
LTSFMDDQYAAFAGLHIGHSSGVTRGGCGSCDLQMPRRSATRANGSGAIANCQSSCNRASRYARASCAWGSALMNLL